MSSEQTKHKFDKKNLVAVAISDVRTNKWNPKEKDTTQYKQVVKSLDINGFMSPIIVRQVENTEGYEIVDGEQRFTAAKELGHESIPIYNLGYISDTDAKSKTIFAEVAVPFNEIDLSHLVVELNELEVALPYTEAEIEDFKHMSEFNFDTFDDDEGEFDDVDVKTFKVTLSDEAYQIVTKAVKKVQDDNDCSEARAIELICADYLAGS
jgi:hypothetical protein